MGNEMMRRVTLRPSSTNRLRRTRSAHGFFCLTAWRLLPIPTHGVAVFGVILRALSRNSPGSCSTERSPDSAELSFRNTELTVTTCDHQAGSTGGSSRGEFSGPGRVRRPRASDAAHDRPVPAHSTSARNWR